MNINMYQWVALVNKHLSETGKRNFLFQELPLEYQDNVLFRRAAHRGFIKKVSMKVPYTEKYGHSGDRRIVWAIAKIRKVEI